MKNRKNLTKGFTLIEMIVVIALIGILMGVAFPQTTKFLAAGRDTKRISDVSRVIPGYLELYFNQEGKYPESTNWNDLVPKLGTDILGGKSLPKAIGNYTYFYCSGENNFTYTLGVKLETKNKALEDSVKGLDCANSFSCCNAGTCSPGNYVYCVQP
jgi:prepilin-type N-terminal cleavage/methylation domain-containing protein